LLPDVATGAGGAGAVVQRSHSVVAGAAVRRRSDAAANLLAGAVDRHARVAVRVSADRRRAVALARERNERIADVAVAQSEGQTSRIRALRAACVHGLCADRGGVVGAGRALLLLAGAAA